MGRVTLEQVEWLAMQLPVVEQQKLVARISEQLSRSGMAFSEKSPPPADELLRELDSIAESISGEFDSGLEIRQIRGGGGEL